MEAQPKKCVSYEKQSVFVFNLWSTTFADNLLAQIVSGGGEHLSDCPLRIAVTTLSLNLVFIYS